MNGILADWQRWRRNLSCYPGRGTFGGLIYCALGLGEAGEAIGEIKKAWRDDKLQPCDAVTAGTDFRREKIMLELGDVLWYLDAACDELSTSLEEIALLNMEKINDRQSGITKAKGQR